MQSSTSLALLHVNLLTSFVILHHDTCNKSGLIQVLATFFNTSEYMEWFVFPKLLIGLQKEECTEERVTVCMQLDNCSSDARFSFRVEAEVVQNVGKVQIARQPSNRD